MQKMFNILVAQAITKQHKNKKIWPNIYLCMNPSQEDITRVSDKTNIHVCTANELPLPLSRFFDRKQCGFIARWYLSVSEKYRLKE